jgi:hypothetical protein
MITLLRNLLAALVYEEVGLHEDEVKVLFDLLPQMLEKAEKDDKFGKKHLSKLIIAYELVSSFNIQSFPFKPRDTIIAELKTQLIWVASILRSILWLVKKSLED